MNCSIYIVSGNFTNKPDKDSILFLDNLVTRSSIWLKNLYQPSAFQVDYNNYFPIHTDSFGSLDTAYCKNLADWQSSTGNDIHTLQEDPQFTGNLGAVPQNQKLNAGIPLSLVKDDFNGNPRSTKNPTIGAFEISHTGTGVSVKPIEPGIILYPNPTHTFLHVRCPGVKIASLQIMDITGRVVFEKLSEETTDEQINTSILPPGLYLVKIATTYGDYSSKFFKQ